MTPRPIKRMPSTFVKKVPHARPAPPAFQPVPSATPEKVATRATEAGSRQNLYVAARDLETWNRAEKLAQPDSLSGLVTSLLRRFVLQREAANDRIVVVLMDRDGIVTRKAFKGRELLPGFRSARTGGWYYAAQGSQGGIAAWWSRDERGPAGPFSTYADFDELSSDEWPDDFLSAVSAALGEEFAEEIQL